MSWCSTQISRGLRLLLLCVALVTTTPSAVTFVHAEISAAVASRELCLVSSPARRARVARAQRPLVTTDAHEFERILTAPRADEDRVSVQPVFLLNCSWLC